VIALAAVELGALAGEVAEGAQGWVSSSQKSILAGRDREFGAPRSKDETSLQVASYEAVMFKGDRKAVGSWAS
jgi:hypothetical protein